MRRLKILLPSLCLLIGCRTNTNVSDHVGPLPKGGHLTATHQLIRPAGESVEFNGRPVDLVASPDGRTLYVKDNRGLAVLDAESWQVRQELKFGATSTHGIVVTRDGSRVLLTGSHTIVWEVAKKSDGKFEVGRKISLPVQKGKGNHAFGGLALSSDEKTAYLCWSGHNSLGILDLVSSNLVKEVSVGVAPYDVVLFDGGKKAFVSNWGGRHPRDGERTAKSAGTDTLVDEKTVAASGTVSVVDLEQGIETAQIVTGLHPSDLELSADGRTLYVANANSDNVSVIDTRTLKVTETILVRPDPTLLFGSAPNALSLSKDGRTLFVANGGNNAIAVVSLAQSAADKSKVEGFIPTAWYPGGLINDGKNLYVANVKGIGSRYQMANKNALNSHGYLGTVTKVEIPASSTLQAYTKQVKADARVPQMLRAQEKSSSNRKPVPVPRRLGEPSVIEHVVYIVKENRTYDQLFGDLPQGNGDPTICTFGREVTPNHHALAEQFALLDNYYCNGVLSADGHAWVTEGYATDYLEKSFGGFARSYPFSGDDPISYAATGFIWDHVLLNGLSFRNYGEMAKTKLDPPAASFHEILNERTNKTGKITYEQDYQIETLRRYSSPDAPGWHMRIPDIFRADVFVKEFDEYEKRGEWPNLTIIFLPCDHTAGTTPGLPTPRAMVADNDLAVGRIVERISKSRFWPKTCIFAIEDDPQAGTDHVDGHRSICLVASPYTKRGAVVSKFYNQTSVLHTMSRMFGIPPMNQMVALSPLMTDCFTSRPDFKPYQCRPNQIPLDEMNPPTAQIKGEELHWARKSLEQNFNEVDRADEDTLNRIIWHSVKGVNTPYPVQLAGAHGKGLRKLGLALDGSVDDD
jgi:YVTN family beta-propeller protein